MKTSPTSELVMASKAYRRWFKTQAAALNQIENAHASVGGKGRGRRYATDQINQAYAVLLASQFQGFCRDLHSESAAYLIDILEPPSMRPIVRAEFTRERKLDRGNANPGSLGQDYGRLGIEFWDEVAIMSSTKRQPPVFHVGDWVKFDYGPKKVSARIVEDRGPLGVQGRRLYRVQLDEDASSFEMPENELDATPPPVRLSYDVRYSREGKTNIWRATTKKNGLLNGVKAAGAVGYLTSSWEGEQHDDQRFATVRVLLEVDPQFGDSGFHVDPNAWSEMADRAGALADEMFLSRHPRARVEHAASV